MNWKYNLSEVLEIPEGYTHFVYLITDNNTKKIYVGYKSFFSTTKKKFGKKKLMLVTDKRLKTYERVTKESNWRDYYGSNQAIKESVKQYGKENFERQILHLCHSNNYLYWEAYYQFKYNVLSIDSYNDNILGKFFRGKV